MKSSLYLLPSLSANASSWLTFGRIVSFIPERQRCSHEAAVAIEGPPKALAVLGDLTVAASHKEVLHAFILAIFVILTSLLNYKGCCLARWRQGVVVAYQLRGTGLSSGI
jgi:hypothetical protein